MSVYQEGLRCEMAIRRFAGLFVLGSLALGYLVDPRWYLFTAFVGFNLVQSSSDAFLPAAEDPRKVRGPGLLP